MDEHRECSRKERHRHEKHHALPLFQLQQRCLCLPGRGPARLPMRARVPLPAGVPVQRLRLLQSNQVNGAFRVVHEERLASRRRGCRRPSLGTRPLRVHDACALAHHVRSDPLSGRSTNSTVDHARRARSRRWCSSCLNLSPASSSKAALNGTPAGTASDFKTRGMALSVRRDRSHTAR